MTENPSTETLAGAEQNVPASDGGVTVESSALTLADLNKQLNSNFKDVPTALKSLKDTKDYVGKRKEDIAAELTRSQTVVPSDVASNPMFKR